METFSIPLCAYIYIAHTHTHIFGCISKELKFYINLNNYTIELQMKAVTDGIKSLASFSCNFKVGSLDIYNLRGYLDAIHRVKQIENT